jgi:hypothetical protein
MKVKQLDRRFSGYGNFKYHIQFQTNELQKFSDVRNWCWQTWGPSCELEHYNKINPPNGFWCWGSTEWYIRIYLATPAEYSWFLLKWGE